MNDEAFLRLAIDLAKQGRQAGEYPFGAVLVYENNIVHQAYDRSIEMCDPTAHVELQVIREYCQSSQKMSLDGYVLYCSTEPCVMCAGAIHWSNLSKVVFSVSQTMLQQLSKGKSKPSATALINIGNKTIKVVGPLLPEEGLTVFDDYKFVSKAKIYEERYL